jgi:hypothetical protein
MRRNCSAYAERNSDESAGLPVIRRAICGITVGVKAAANSTSRPMFWGGLRT